MMYRGRESFYQYAGAQKLDKKIWMDIESQIKHEVFGMPREVDVLCTGLYRVTQPIESKFFLFLNSNININ